MKIDCSKYCDGQGAFKNGMHDYEGLMSANLYRRGLWNRTMWSLGWYFQKLTRLGHVRPLSEMRNAKLKLDFLLARIDELEKQAASYGCSMCGVICEGNVCSGCSEDG